MRAAEVVARAAEAWQYGRRLVVEQNAAAPVDLQIDEAGGQESSIRQARLRPIGWNLAPVAKSSDTSIPDQHRGVGMPAATVENSLRQEGVLARMAVGT